MKTDIGKQTTVKNTIICFKPNEGFLCFHIFLAPFISELDLSSRYLIVSNPTNLVHILYVMLPNMFLWFVSVATNSTVLSRIDGVVNINFFLQSW